jgi:hypothetical protein
MQPFNLELATLRERVDAQYKELMIQGKEIYELRGNLQQLEKIVSASARQSIWQMIAMIVTLSGSVIGALAYQTHMIDKRFEQMDKRIDSVEKNLANRIDFLEKNLNGRFEDFKQEIRAQHKQ